MIEDIEIILIEDNDNLRFELQKNRNNNTIGPFIRKKTILQDSANSIFSKKYNDILLELKFFSIFLEFPITIEKKENNYIRIYKEAERKGIKKYEFSRGKSLKRKEYKIIKKYKEKFNNYIEITKLVFYIEFKKDFIILNPFIRVDESQVIPIYKELKDNVISKYPDLNKYISKYINEYIWIMNIIDFDIFNQLSTKYIKNNELVLLIKNSVSKNGKSSFKSNNDYNIDWLDSTSINTDEIINDRIITNYISNKQYSSFTDFNNNEIENNNKNKDQIISRINKNTHSNFKDILVPKNSYDLEVELKNLGFSGDLKDHQKYGIQWILDKYQKKQKGVLLADEMGLGKTIQSLSVLAYLNDDNFNCIIICPSSLKHNWLSEIKKFYPSLLKKTHLIENKDSELTNGINIISCELSKIKNDILDKCYNLLIFDEAQRIKNKHTKLWERINELDIPFKILLTGSPVENSENDLLNIIEIISMHSELAIWNSIQNNDTYKSEISENKVLIIKSFFENYILVRKKEEVINLPDCNVEYIKIKMDNSMRYTYDIIRKQFIYNLSKNKGAHSFMALDALLRLRQLCSLPQLIIDNFPDLNISTYSPKADKVEKIIYDSINTNNKIVLFSVFVGVLDEFEKRLEKKGINIARIDGNVSTLKRKDEIERFTKSKECKILLSSLHVGGVGLNLVEANTVIIYNSWWNPAIENQAISRVHRMGQNKTVNVYIPIYEDSIEEKILELLKYKRKITESFTDKSFNLKDYIELLK